MAGLKSVSSKIVESIALPLHGSPLMFQVESAATPQLANMVFNAFTDHSIEEDSVGALEL